MAKRVFFSFHYQDVLDFRANVVRNHWRFKPDRESAGFFDASIWESAKKKGDLALKRLINGAITGTTATCVLIGDETYARPWVRYEIFRSLYANNHLFGVHINGIKDKDGKDKHNKLGPNPFDHLALSFSGNGTRATPYYYTGKQWRIYLNHDAWTIPARPQAERGKMYKLSHWHRTYLWNKDKGYENFSTWVNVK